MQKKKSWRTETRPLHTYPVPGPPYGASVPPKRKSAVGSGDHDRKLSTLSHNLRELPPYNILSRNGNWDGMQSRHPEQAIFVFFKRKKSPNHDPNFIAPIWLISNTVARFSQSPITKPRKKIKKNRLGSKKRAPKTVSGSTTSDSKTGFTYVSRLGCAVWV